MKRNKIFLGIAASLLILTCIVLAKQQKRVIRALYTTANFNCVKNTCTIAAIAAATEKMGQAGCFVGPYPYFYTKEGCFPLYTGL